MVQVSEEASEIRRCNKKATHQAAHGTPKGMEGSRGFCRGLEGGWRAVKGGGRWLEGSGWF